MYHFFDLLLKVIRRDGYTCVITGYQDFSHPKLDANVLEVELVGAHILPRAVGEFDSNPNSEYVGDPFFQSAPHCLQSIYLVQVGCYDV